MTFQTSDFKGRQFLELLDNDLNPLELSTKNGGLWLKLIDHSNSFCARATRVIVNHTPIGKYQLRLFPRKNFICLCGAYPIESRRHILYECKQFNNYWNLRRDTIAHLILFLEFNSSVFSFKDGQVQPFGLLHFNFSLLLFVLFLSFSFLFFYSLFVISVCMYIVIKQLPQSALTPHIINC